MAETARSVRPRALRTGGLLQMPPVPTMGVQRLNCHCRKLLLSKSSQRLSLLAKSPRWFLGHVRPEKQRALCKWCLVPGRVALLAV